ncbi:3-isopropylmalate dehydratase large subunit [candidate division LCP-89 bacterium B3_LCP]|uniref:3-isopropylmalate dehydratase large subunit n=1 Tax=candidate division LCP-89 bacterium B3_LCP TaxID=2012998 RepID=A0A532UYN9_UNCL8|nr:MAG: 3-isopropylmalate dehydratase large subunit [candidate division LCP-89 bacterium B3_LCP]
MSQTIAQKIFARHAGKDTVETGELVFAKVDMILGTDVTVPLSVEVFRRMGAKEVFDPRKIVLVNDHFVPAKDLKAAELSKTMREFAQEMGIFNYFEVGRSGICHVLLPDEGLVKPGDLIVGADSHTCTYGALGAFSTGIGSTDMAAAWTLGELWFRVPDTIKLKVNGNPPKWVGGKDIAIYIIGKLGVEGALYKAMEFSGSTIDNLSMDGRFTLCNMAIEAGAKAGIVPPDDKTGEFMQSFPELIYEPMVPDDNAEYSAVYNFDVSDLPLQVAKPYLPSNAAPVDEVKGKKVHQVVLGSCTNGRLSDFKLAAEAMKGNAVHKDTKLIVIPSSNDVYLEMIDAGLVTTFIEAGAVVGPPTCGPCIGGHMGVLAENEVGLYTTNRNFVGRNGHQTSEVYLAGPAVAGATAIAGEIAHPDDI